MELDKYTSRKNRAKVREILLQHWDPIGISGVPDAQDEYDAYADAVYVMLQNGKDASVIAAYLIEIATNRMGFPLSEELKKKSVLAAERVADST